MAQFPEHLRTYARDEAAWHAELANMWKPWPFWFGPLGNSARYHFHCLANAGYRSAASDLDTCVALGTACNKAQFAYRYEHFHDQVAWITRVRSYAEDEPVYVTVGAKSVHYGHATE